MPNRTSKMTHPKSPDIVHEPPNALNDPFDSPLEPDPSEKLVLNDTLFAEARDAVTVEGMDYSFLKPPYMEFEDQRKAKLKLIEAYRQREFLMLYGYSGCGKTTILKQFAEKYAPYVRYFEDFDSLSPAQLVVEIGKKLNIPLKMRTRELQTLKEHFKAMPPIILLFDEVTASGTKGVEKLTLLRKLYGEKAVPIVICGTPYLHNCIYIDEKHDLFDSIISRLDEHEMRGMTRQDAGEYIRMVAGKENLQFTYPAEQALIQVALNKYIGGINAFTTIIGRCITLARVHYYRAPGHTMPETAKCIRSEVQDEGSYPGAKLIITLPITPEPIRIDEQIVSQMMAEYKSHFPQVSSPGSSTRDLLI